MPASRRARAGGSRGAAGDSHETQLLALVAVVLLFAAMAHAAKYGADRAQILKNEDAPSLSSSVTLAKEEELMKTVIAKLKTQEYRDFDEEKFLPAQSFVKSRATIAQSALFSFLSAMPKGASLHTHVLAAVGADYVIDTLSYTDNLYMYYANGKLKLRFMNATDAEKCAETYGECVKLSEKRRNGGAKDFDRWLRHQLQFTVEDVEKAMSKAQKWTKLSGIFTTLYDMLTFRPVFERFLAQALQELLDDNVLYAEFRGTFMELYELDGTKYDVMQSLQIMQDAFSAFTQKHNESFLGAGYIFSPYRKLSDDDLRDALKLLKEAHRKFPQLIVGFDLVGYEDAGGSLVSRVDALQHIHKDVRFYFHAGETNWHGTEADLNLLDAIMLGSKRVGHALSLWKHPELMRLVRERRVAVEVAPVSNQVLGYVEDLRAHPAVLYARLGIPLVVCNDDPTAFGNVGLTYDFYEAFMALTQIDDGPEFLKSVALNSIGFSSMDSVQRRKAYEMFEDKWKIWSHSMLALTKFFGRLNH